MERIECATDTVRIGSATVTVNIVAFRTLVQQNTIRHSLLRCTAE